LFLEEIKGDKAVDGFAEVQILMGKQQIPLKHSKYFMHKSKV
jgi:hypothetical protein